MSALERIKSTLARDGGQHLGDVIWWTLAEARTSRSTLESIWNTTGLDLGHLPEPPTAEKAIKAAARTTALGQADRLIRLGLEDESSIVFAIVHEERHRDGSLTYSQEARVVLDRDSEKATTDSPGHDLAEGILARYSELKNAHSSDDVRRAMMNVLGSCAAVTLRDHGGVYWIPAPHAETLRRLQSAVEKFGTSRVYLLPVHDSAQAQRTLGDAAKLAIEDELATLKAEVEGFIAIPPDRPSTLVRRLDAFEALRGRAALYRDVLRVHVEDLDKTLADLTGSVEHLLNDKAAA
jgi:hypothetical protein